jgi:hypothetical protein
MRTKGRNSGKKKRGVAITKADFVERAKNVYGIEYWKFWAIFWGFAPETCPKCGCKSIRTLNLALPNNRAAGKMWFKWYLWCESCLNGIYCPLGTYWLEPSRPYILWGDREALRQALPENLHLIKPTVSRMAKVDHLGKRVGTEDLVNR